MKIKNIGKINLIDPTDNWLLKRIQIVAKGIELSIYDNPLFINRSKDIETFSELKKNLFQTTFYKQRKKLGLLIDKEVFHLAENGLMILKIEKNIQKIKNHLKFNISNLVLIGKSGVLY